MSTQLNVKNNGLIILKSYKVRILFCIIACFATND